MVMQTSACGDALRHCNTCQKRETAGVKLRRCSGCSTAVYCSTQCQKAEWPRHKPACRIGTAEDSATVARYGYASVSAFSRDLQDFMDAHTWAFRMLGDKNDLVWAQSAAIREEAHRAYTLQYPSYTGQLFAVEFKVPGTNAGAMNYFPLLTPVVSASGTPEQRRPVLEDMAAFCTRSSNHGFPMRMMAFGDAFSVLAYPGTFVRSQGRWTWKAILQKWKSYVPGRHRGLDLALAELKTQLAMPKLIVSTLYFTGGVNVLVSQAMFSQREVLAEAYYEV